MKRMVWIVSSVIFVVLVLGTFVHPVLAAPKILKCSAIFTVASPNYFCPTWFANEFEKRTKGAYKVDFYKGGTLGKGPDLVRLCGDGTVDFVVLALGYNPNLWILSRCWELMYITDNTFANAAAAWDMVLNYAPLHNEWERNGLIPTIVQPVGNMAAQSKTPINKVEDLKGLKVRGYAAVVKLIQRWGAIPIAISFPEVYDALNRGLIHGAFGVPYQEVYAARLFEVAPYVFDTGVGAYGMNVMATSKKTYDSFPPDVKKIFDQLVEEGKGYFRTWNESYNKEMTVKMINEKSIKFNIWSKEEKARAKSMAVPYIYEDWLKEAKDANLPGEETLETYKKLIAKYELQYPCTLGFDTYKSLKK